jgi:glucose-6-phosphate 1-dehydrogenase
MASQDSDVAGLLVIFGSSGDLHRTRTFRALYRPEQRRSRWQQPWLSAEF